jgi:hypothetical protein
LGRLRLGGCFADTGGGALAHVANKVKVISAANRKNFVRVIS